MNNKADLKNILKEIRDLTKDIDETSEDVDDIKEEVEGTGKDVDDIKEEVEGTGKDVDEIKEDIEFIKEDIGKLGKKGLLSRVKSIPEKFEIDDLAQQIVGATILSAPFVVTEEVWMLATNMQIWQIIAILLLTITFDILLFFYTKYQKIKQQRIGNFIPLRIISLLTVTYLVSTIMLFIFGVIGGQVASGYASVKLVILVGLFANIGAGTADLIR